MLAGGDDEVCQHGHAFYAHAEKLVHLFLSARIRLAKALLKPACALLSQRLHQRNGLLEGAFANSGIICKSVSSAISRSDSSIGLVSK